MNRSAPAAAPRGSTLVFGKSQLPENSASVVAVSSAGTSSGKAKVSLRHKMNFPMRGDRIRFESTLPSGEQDAVIHRSDGTITTGVVGDLKDGQPIPEGAEVFQMRKTSDSDGWHDMETIYKQSSGPAQVATPAYRDGYDRIFGGKSKAWLA